MKQMCFLIVAVCVLSAGCSTVKKAMPDMNLLKVERAQLAEKITGLEARIAQMAINMDGQAAAVAGVNNQVSKVSSEVKARDIGVYNDGEIMTQYISALKEQRKIESGMFKYVVGGLIFLLLKAYVIIYFFTRSMLKARDKDDESEDKLMDKLIENKGGRNV